MSTPETTSRLDTTELEQRLGQLPADTEVVAYCRGPFCAYAHEAVRQLRAAGRPARRLEGGWPEWQLAHEKTEAAPETRVGAGSS